MLVGLPAEHYLGRFEKLLLRGGAPASEAAFTRARFGRHRCRPALGTLDASHPGAAISQGAGLNHPPRRSDGGRRGGWPWTMPGCAMTIDIRIPDELDGVPNISGSEYLIDAALREADAAGPSRVLPAPCE